MYICSIPTNRVHMVCVHPPSFHREPLVSVEIHPPVPLEEPSLNETTRKPLKPPPLLLHIDVCLVYGIICEGSMWPLYRVYEGFKVYVRFKVDALVSKHSTSDLRPQL